MKLHKVVGNFNTFNNSRDKRHLYMAAPPEAFSHAQALSIYNIFGPSVAGRLALPERPTCWPQRPSRALSDLHSLKSSGTIYENGNRSTKSSHILLNATLLTKKKHLPSQPCSLQQSHILTRGTLVSSPSCTNLSVI
jgi:hypothetical protein